MEHNKQVIRRNLNLRSLAVGFLLAIFLLLVVGAAGSYDNNSQRYQCCAAGDEQLAVFVIETETGHTCRLSRNDMYDFGTPSEPRSIRQSIRPIVD
jgi:hypothetical protein